MFHPRRENRKRIKIKEKQKHKGKNIRNNKLI